MSSVSVRSRGGGLSKSGQNVCAISISMLEEKEAKLVRCGKSNSSVLSQRQRLVHTASVASENLNNMELKFVLGGVTACMKTESKSNKSSAETSPTVALKNAIDEPKFDAAHANKVPESDDYLKYRPAPQSKRKVLLTKFKDTHLSLQTLPSADLASFKKLPNCENHTLEECTKMILKLLEAVDGITQLQKEVYGIIHQLYGYLIKKTTNDVDFLRPYSTTSASPISNEISKTQISDENDNTVKNNRGMNNNAVNKNEITRTDVKSASFPISVNNTKVSCAKMIKALITRDVIQTNETFAGHGISKVVEVDDDDSDLLVIDEGLPLTCAKNEKKLMNCENMTAQIVEDDTQMHNNDDLRRELVTLSTTVNSNNQINGSKGMINDVQNITNESMKSVIDATKFQPHLFTSDTISAIPITKCIHLFPTSNNFNEITINTLGASPTPSTPISQKEKNKKAITLSLPFDKFESFAQSKLEHNVQVSDKNKVTSGDEKELLTVAKQKSSKCKTIVDIVNELLNNNSKKKCTRRKRKNKNEATPLDNETIKSKTNNDKIDTSQQHSAIVKTPQSVPLIVKKKRKVQVYRIPKKMEEATSDKHINEKITDPISKVDSTATSTPLSPSTNNNITPMQSSPLTNKQVNEVFTLSSSIPLTASHPSTNNKNTCSTKPSFKLVTTTTPNTNPIYSPKQLLNNFALQPVVKISKNIMGQHSTCGKEKSRTSNELLLSGGGNDVTKRKRKHVPIIYDVKNNNKRTSRYSSRILNGDLRKKLKTACDDNNGNSESERPTHNRDTSINRKSTAEREYSNYRGIQPRHKTFPNVPYKSRFWYTSSGNQYRYT